MLADHSLAGGIVVPELLSVLLQVSQQIHSFSHPTQPFWVDCVLLEASMGQIDKWTNEEIVSGCVTLDPEARRVLYEKYSAQMYSICMRYAKDKEGAGDIFQDGFYRVYKNIGQLKNVEALSGWIKSIFVNAGIEYCKKANRTIYLEDVESHSFNPPFNWNAAISNISTQEIIGLIQELPQGCRNVFNMYVIEGFSHKEIAQLLQISTGTSKSQLHDARKILKQKLTKLAIFTRPAINHE